MSVVSSVHQPNVVAKDREQILTKKGQATRKGSACLGTGQRKHEEAVTIAITVRGQTENS